MNIRKSVAALPREEFEQTLESLSDRRNTLYLVGGRFTDAVATYAYMHLRVLRPQVRHVSGTPLSWPEYILDTDLRSVVIAFDVRGYEEDIIRFADEAAERGAHVVRVTDPGCRRSPAMPSTHSRRTSRCPRAGTRSPRSSPWWRH